MPRLSPGASSPGLPTFTTQCTIGFVGPGGLFGYLASVEAIFPEILQVYILAVVLGRSDLLTIERLCPSDWPGVANSNVRLQPDWTLTVPGTKRIPSWTYLLTTNFISSATFTVAPHAFAPRPTRIACERAPP